MDRLSGNDLISKVGDYVLGRSGKRERDPVWYEDHSGRLLYDKPLNIRSVTVIEDKEYFILSQNPKTTRRMCDLLIDRRNGSLVEFASESDPLFPKQISMNPARSLKEYSAFLGIIDHENDQLLVFCVLCSIKLLFEQNVIYCIESIELVSLKGSSQLEDLNRRINNVEVRSSGVKRIHSFFLQ